jgi:hypothetical protein
LARRLNYLGNTISGRRGAGGASGFVLPEGLTGPGAGCSGAGSFTGLFGERIPAAGLGAFAGIFLAAEGFFAVVFLTAAFFAAGFFASGFFAAAGFFFVFSAVFFTPVLLRAVDFFVTVFSAAVFLFDVLTGFLTADASFFMIPPLKDYELKLFQNQVDYIIIRFLCLFSFEKYYNFFEFFPETLSQKPNSGEFFFVRKFRFPPAAVLLLAGRFSTSMPGGPLRFVPGAGFRPGKNPPAPGFSL